MIRHREKIQGAVQLYAGAVVGVLHRLPHGEAIGHRRVRTKIVVEKRIEGIGAVQMRIAPEQLLLRGLGQ